MIYPSLSDFKVVADSKGSWKKHFVTDLRDMFCRVRFNLKHSHRKSKDSSISSYVFPISKQWKKSLCFQIFIKSFGSVEHFQTSPWYTWSDREWGLRNGCCKSSCSMHAPPDFFQWRMATNTCPCRIMHWIWPLFPGRLWRFWGGPDRNRMHGPYARHLIDDVLW